MTSDKTKNKAYEAAKRIRAILHNQPKSQYMRLTKEEAEALASVVLEREQ